MRTNVSVGRDRTVSPVGRSRLRSLTGLRVPALAAVIALTLVGCAPSLPVARPDPVPAVPPPVLSVAQSTAVLGSIKTVLATGDANLSDVALGTRLSGPALAIRSAEYKLDLGTGGVRVPTMLPMTAQALITPQTTTWPRSELVVTVQPDNLQSPRLLVLRQTHPGSTTGTSLSRSSKAMSAPSAWIGSGSWVRHSRRVPGSAWVRPVASRYAGSRSSPRRGTSCSLRSWTQVSQ